MLKKRIGAALIVKDGIVVQSIGFKKYLPVGKPAIAVEFLNLWGIDEIIMLDITATKNKRSIDPALVRETSKDCYVPLTTGGGIVKMSQVDELIQSGADKIMLNNILFKDPSFATAIARKYGDQCVVACMDVKRNPDGRLVLYDHAERKIFNQDPGQWATKLEGLGAGEILVHTVDKDGSKTGFDIEAYNQICENVNVPVIALGGAGQPDHFMEVFKKSDVSAACAGNYFHFTEHSVITTKAYLLRKNMDLRLETHANYINASITEKNRLLKNSDDTLEHLLYLKIEKEII